jgi:rubrerythrin
MNADLREIKEKSMFAPPVIWKCKSCGSEYWDNEIDNLRCPLCGGREMSCKRS